MTSHAVLRVVTPEQWASPFRSLVHGRLAALKRGSLAIVERSGRRAFGSAAAGSPEITLTVNDPAFYRKLALGGTIGAAEAYMDGDFEVDELTGLVQLCLQNPRMLSGLEGGLARLGIAAARSFHRRRRNTRANSQDNIRAHYDLGNDFFARMLDATMMYSSAVFPHPTATLEEASRHKLELLCDALALAPGEHLLEIGTGWGELAVHAARRGARVTTTTLSAEQERGARERIEAAGLDSRVEVLRKDYRDLTGRYDKLVSVEMIEAVGAEYYDTFFAKCAALLRPGGKLALQAITIVDQAYERQRREPDFIKRYIFPGSCIPSVTALGAAATRASDLRMLELRDHGLHYARTIAAWRTNLEPRRAWVLQRYGERFWRMWMFYFAYCEAGFTEGYISVVHMLFERPRWGQP
jgi:cyclopropane-fatty-acyl-phospholipid synthase